MAKMLILLNKNVKESGPNWGFTASTGPGFRGCQEMVLGRPGAEALSFHRGLQEQGDPNAE